LSPVRDKPGSIGSSVGVGCHVWTDARISRDTGEEREFTGQKTSPPGSSPTEKYIVRDAPGGAQEVSTEFIDFEVGGNGGGRRYVL